MSRSLPVVEGVLLRVSPSQMTSFDPSCYGGCERRWWYRNVEGRPEPTTPREALGEQVHSEIQAYLTTGEDRLGKLAGAGRRFLPRPGPDLLVETWLEGLDLVGEDAGGGPWTLPVLGRVDVMHRRGEWVDDDGEVRPEPGTAEVEDWKTTRRIADEVDPDTGQVTARGYAKTSKEIADSWQMLVYAEAARRLWPDVRAVRVSHGYFETGGRVPAAEKRSALLPAAEIVGRWRGDAAALAGRMRAAARLPRATDVPANRASCRAYGGCPHRSYCPTEDNARLALAVGGGGGRQMSLFPQIMQIRAGQAAAAEPVPVPPVASPSTGSATVPVPPPAPVSAGAAPDPVEAAVAALVAEEAAARGYSASIQVPGVPIRVAPPDAPAPSRVAEPHPGGPPSVGGQCAADMRDLTVKEGIERKVRCRCGAVVKVQPQEVGEGRYRGLVRAHASGPAAPAPRAAAPAPVAPTTAAVPVTVFTPPAPVTVVLAPAVAASDNFTGAPVPTAPAPAPAQVGFDVLIDCVPQDARQEVYRLEDVARAISREVGRAHGAPDARLITDANWGFGRWKVAVEEAASAVKLEPGAVYCVDSGDELGMVVAQAIWSRARTVVRGTRS